MVKMEKHTRSIVVLILSPKPNVGFVRYALQQLISAKFTQYEGYTEEMLCSQCVQELNLRTESVNSKICLKHLGTDSRGNISPISFHSTLIHKCNIHNQEKHHIFVSYRVDAEGEKGTKSHPVSRPSLLLPLLFVFLSFFL